ncbi:RNA polymerase sigma factor SigZ [Desmospora profundinema]|uniref:RNA polymerase sigma factor SigZ n=1 Tax=Desmospora profundinema TaxID=1571184 RepID=A0ABU1IK49_9BACL|nr:RNA polymerase sigma factor SigZ [Desmospora profundinema]MDR6225133.1 RNA polymerase sigma-70 factor (ECF subfamily) [Desmospora profundinema]
MMNIDIIWNEFHNQLKKFLLKRIHDPYAVEDVLQEIFIKIYTQIDQLKDKQKLRPWIYQITRNALIDYYRKKEPVKELPLFLSEFDKNPDQEEEDEDLSKELSQCLRPMIDQLPLKYREAIEMTELEGYTQKELSEKLGISFSGAKSRVQRGRKKLKQFMLDCCHFEFDRLGYIMNYEVKSDCSTPPKCSSPDHKCH